ncbi:MAG TPA: MmoB/DmpM family protein [Dermatophilaceae bacterium]|jgi:phenol hydroxylase P2 protein|nr:MmoB/DmpM family protein [Actinomycetales bacterium]HMT33227.1 MmoB/DmpM family protein [Dermatophilaceae bacterium]HMT90176.1 MmoB/DmpM family protein [Dermatophilaceae bacterium]
MNDPATRMVSVDLQENEENRAVIEAIEADNPNVRVRHMPGVVKIEAPGRLVIKRESVEERLGRDWETHEFQMAIITLAGNITEWDDDEIVLAWNARR